MSPLRSALPLLLLAASACASRAPATPAEPVVVYREIREGGDPERQIAGGDRTYAAVDINSRVNIDVDETALNAASGGAAGQERARRLTQRLEQLHAALDAVPRAELAQKAAVDAWQQAAASGDFGGTEALIRERAQARLIVLTPLRAVIRDRLTEEAQPQLIDAAFDALASSDWRAIGATIGDEIRMAEAGLDRLVADGLALQIRAYRVGQDGSTVPIALDRYNEVVEGAPVRTPKVVRTVDENTLATYRKYQQVAAKMESVQGLGNALRAAFEAELGSRKETIDRAVQAARTLVNSSGAALDEAATALPRLPEALVAAVGDDAEIVALARDVETLWRGVATDVQLIRNYAALADRFGSMAPDEAMTTLLAVTSRFGDGAAAANAGLASPAVWNERLQQVTALVTALRALEAADLTAVRTAVPQLTVVTDFATRIEQPLRTFLTEVRPLADLMNRVIGVRPTIETAAGLPDPPGQRSLSLASSADTYLDLKTIAEGRNEGDEILIQYRTLTEDDEEVGLSWEDRLAIGSYGLHSRTVASLGFMAREGTSSFSPAPTLSYMIHYRNWPDGVEPGLRRGFESYLSAGLSTMSLDFSDDDDVELGLAGTVGLFDNLVLGGLGVNLQHDEDRLFYFFSVRLFSASGGLGNMD